MMFKNVAHDTATHLVNFHRSSVLFVIVVHFNSCRPFYGLGLNLCGLLLWSPPHPDSLIASPDLAALPPLVRPRLPPCLLLRCLELSMCKWCTERNSGIKNKEWAAAAAGFGVTGEVGRSSCELEFQRPTPAEVVGSAHTFHISQSSLGWDSQKEGELSCFVTANHLLKVFNITYVDTLKNCGAIGLLLSFQQSVFWNGGRKQKRAGRGKKSGNIDCS